MNTSLASLRDNRPSRGTVGDFLREHASKLVDAAIESIKRTFARRATASLISGRDGQLPKAGETPSPADDMELVTWLVIQTATA